MKKRFLQITVLLFLCLFASGCRAKYDYDFQINEDRTFDFYELYGVLYPDNFELSEDPVTNMQNFANQLTDLGYDVDFTRDEKYLEIIIRKQFPLDQLLTDSNDPFLLHYNAQSEEWGLFTKKRTVNSTVYTANWIWVYGVYDVDEENKLTYYSSPEGENDVDIAFMYPSLGNSFKVSLPFKPISSNATRTDDDGKTLIWDLNDTGDNEIQFSFAFPEESLIVYNPKHFSILTDNLVVGQNVIISYADIVNPNNISIVDSSGNEISFEVVENGISFQLPDSPVHIHLKNNAPVNPKTGKSFILFTLVLLLIGFTCFRIKKKYN